MDYGIDNDDAIKDLEAEECREISQCGGDGEAKLTSTGMQGCVKRPSPVGGKRARKQQTALRAETAGVLIPFLQE